jgi:hypothetical protein
VPQPVIAKYRREREKPLRSEGIQQYRDVRDGFARLLADPFVAPGSTRGPLADEVELVLIGDDSGAQSPGPSRPTGVSLGRSRGGAVSGEADFLNGHSRVVDGGQSMQSGAMGA